MIVEVPLISTPQQFSVFLNGVSYDLTLKWNEFGQRWVMDIALTSGGMLVSGIPLVVGQDLIEQFTYFEIGGMLVVQSDYDVLAAPTFDNLGTLSHMYFVTQ